MSTLGQRLRVNAKPVSVAVPHYAQSLDFTCGPSSLLMVMKALDPAAEFDRKANEWLTLVAQNAPLTLAAIKKSVHEMVARPGTPTGAPSAIRRR